MMNFLSNETTIHSVNVIRKFFQNLSQSSSFIFIFYLRVLNPPANFFFFSPASVRRVLEFTACVPLFGVIRVSQNPSWTRLQIANRLNGTQVWRKAGGVKYVHIRVCGSVVSRQKTERRKKLERGMPRGYKASSNILTRALYWRNCKGNKLSRPGRATSLLPVCFLAWSEQFRPRVSILSLSHTHTHTHFLSLRLLFSKIEKLREKKGGEEDLLVKSCFQEPKLFIAEISRNAFFLFFLSFVLVVKLL